MSAHGSSPPRPLSNTPHRCVISWSRPDFSRLAFLVHPLAGTVRPAGRMRFGWVNLVVRHALLQSMPSAVLLPTRCPSVGPWRSARVLGASRSQDGRGRRSAWWCRSLPVPHSASAWEALLPAPVGAGRFVIRATHERGVGVPSSRSLATATREANSVYEEVPTCCRHKRTVWGAGMRRLRSLTGSIPVPRTTVCAVQRWFSHLGFGRVT